MNEAVTEVTGGGSVLTTYAHEIRATHAASKVHAELAVVFALRTGLLCLQARQQVGHGNFTKWVARECPEMTDRTVRKYMALAESKSEPDSVLPAVELTAVGFVERVADDGGYRERIVSSVRSAVGAGSLTQLYQTYGIISPRSGASARTPAPDVEQEDEVRGLYTPHAVRVTFTRALRQTVDRVPLDKWTPQMRRGWVAQLKPIADFVKKIEETL